MYVCFVNDCSSMFQSQQLLSGNMRQQQMSMSERFLWQ